MKKVIGFGDYMLRLGPEGYLKFIQADRFVLNYTGAEGNVVTSLAYMGVPAELVTKLPENAIAECAEANLRKYRVGCEHIAHGGERIGIFYAEKGASQRPSGIVYDRKHSAFSTSEPEDYDWNEILDGAGYFHFTGITPALGGKLPDAIGIPEEELRQAAKMAVCKINIDSDIRLAMTAGIRRVLSAQPDVFDPRTYLSVARDEVRKMVAHKIKDVLGSENTL